MIQVLDAGKLGHCLHEAGIGLWKSYERLAVGIP